LVANADFGPSKRFGWACHVDSSHVFEYHQTNRFRIHGCGQLPRQKLSINYPNHNIQSANFDKATLDWPGEKLMR
jgi:hypothetical protein